MDGDLDLLRDLIAVFAAEVPGMLSRIDAAIQGSDAAELERAGHKIKGSMMQFSAPTAVTAAGRLEELGSRKTVAGAEALLRTLRHEIDLVMTLVNSMICRMAESSRGSETKRSRAHE